MKRDEDQSFWKCRQPFVLPMLHTPHPISNLSLSYFVLKGVSLYFKNIFFKQIIIPMCFQLPSRVFPLRFDRAGKMVGPVCPSPRRHLLGKHQQQPHSLHDESQHRQRDRLHSAGEKWFVRNKPEGSGFVLTCSGSTLDLDRRKTDSRESLDSVKTDILTNMMLLSVNFYIVSIETLDLNSLNRDISVTENCLTVWKRTSQSWLPRPQGLVRKLWKLAL